MTLKDPERKTPRDITQNLNSQDLRNPQRLVEGRGEAPLLLEGSKQCNLLLPCLRPHLVGGRGDVAKSMPSCFLLNPWRHNCS